MKPSNSRFKSWTERLLDPKARIRHYESKIHRKLSSFVQQGKTEKAFVLATEKDEISTKRRSTRIARLAYELTKSAQREQVEKVLPCLPEDIDGIDSPKSCQLMGKTFALLSEPVRAKKCYSQGLKLAPKQYQNYFSLAGVLVSLDEEEELAQLVALAEQNLPQIHSQTLRAEILRLKGFPFQAGTCLQNIAHSDELPFTFHLELAQIANDSKQYSSALELSEKALSLKSESLAALSVKGKALYHLKRYNESLKHWTNLIENNRFHYVAYEYLFRTLINLKDLKQAEAVAHKLYTLDGKDFRRLQPIFQALRLMSKEKTIERYIRMVEYQFKSNRTSLEDYIGILAVGGWFRKAHKELEKVSSQLPVNEKRQHLLSIQLAEKEYLQAWHTWTAISDIEFRNRRGSQKMQLANLLASKWNLNIENGSFSLSVVDKLLENLPDKPIYEPQKNTVLIILNSLAMGGSERQVANTARQFYAEHGEDFQCHFALRSIDKESGADFFNPIFKDTNIKLHDFVDLLGRYDGDHFTKGDFLQDIFEFGENLISFNGIFEIFRCIQVLKPSVLHVRGGMASETAIAGLLAGVPSILLHFGSMIRKWQSDGTDNYEKRIELNRNVFRRIERFESINFACNSQSAIDEWTDFLGFSRGRFKLIRNGLDRKVLGAPSEVAMGNIREELNIPEDAPLIGSVMRLQKVKDPLLFVETAKKVHEQRPDAHFLLVGDGVLRHEVVKAVKKNELESCFHLPGGVLHGIADYYKLMDLFLLTSVTESLPNVILEAQSFGVPAVGPDVGGVKEALIPGETGWVVPERLPESLAQQVLAVLAKDREELNRIRDKAIEFIDKTYSLEQMSAATKDVYGTAVEQ